MLRAKTAAIKKHIHSQWVSIASDGAEDKELDMQLRKLAAVGVNRLVWLCCAADEPAPASSIITSPAAAFVAAVISPSYPFWHDHCLINSCRNAILGGTTRLHHHRSSGGAILVQWGIFAFKWCGALRKNQQYKSKIFTLSQTKC